MDTRKKRLKFVGLTIIYFILIGVLGIPLGIWWIITGKSLLDKFWDKYIRPLFENGKRN